MPTEEVSKDPWGNPGAGADCTPHPQKTTGQGNQSKMRANHVPEHPRPGVAFCSEARSAGAAFQQISHVPEIPGQRYRLRSNQHTGREVLHQQEQAIAFHVVGLQRRKPAGCVRVVVLYHGIGNV